MLYPEANDGSPGSVLADRGIRAVFRGYQGAVEIHNEYLDVSRFPDSSFQDDLAKFFRRKYAGRKTDLVIAGLGRGSITRSNTGTRFFPAFRLCFARSIASRSQSGSSPRT